MSELTPKQTLQIDEEGFLVSGGARLTDAAFGKEILSNLFVDDKRRLLSTHEEQTVLVQPFSTPYVVQDFKLQKNSFEIQLMFPYEFYFNFSLKRLCIDPWDRFCGWTETGIGFVFSRKAQAQFFENLENFSDDSFEWNGEEIPLGLFRAPETTVKQTQFWNELYKQKERPSFDLEAAHPYLPSLGAQLKLPTSRVLILGSGRGHDADYWAQQGHSVTAVDFSEEAIAASKKKYSHDRLRWVSADAFLYVQQNHQSFDVVFEHTFFCAISPEERQKLVKSWVSALVPRGMLIGIFNIRQKQDGPPFSATQWEIRELLKKNFEFLYWTPCPKSPAHRENGELIVIAQKKAF